MTMPTAHHIVYMPLSELVPADRNPKAHDLEALRASMDRFGFTEPLMLDERTGKLVAGHGRLENLQGAVEAGLDPPEGVVADPATGEWAVPVVRGWASRDDKEAEAYLLASNRITERGGWEKGGLVDLLDELATAGELDGTGFTADDLDDLLAELNAGEMPTAPTDAQHAEQTGRGEPGVPREVQGLREVGLLYNQQEHREYQELLARLKRKYGTDVGPAAVLQAMREAAGV